MLLAWTPHQCEHLTFFFCFVLFLNKFLEFRLGSAWIWAHFPFGGSQRPHCHVPRCAISPPVRWDQLFWQPEWRQQAAELSWTLWRKQPSKGQSEQVPWQVQAVLSDTAPHNVANNDLKIVLVPHVVMLKLESGVCGSVQNLKLLVKLFSDLSTAHCAHLHHLFRRRMRRSCRRCLTPRPTPCCPAVQLWLRSACVSSQCCFLRFLEYHTLTLCHPLICRVLGQRMLLTLCLQKTVSAKKTFH